MSSPKQCHLEITSLAKSVQSYSRALQQDRHSTWVYGQLVGLCLLIIARACNQGDALKSQNLILSNFVQNEMLTAK